MTMTNTEIHDAKMLVANEEDGHQVRLVDPLLLIADNPQFKDDDGSNPRLVINVRKLVEEVSRLRGLLYA